jgi:glutamate synthase (NADPH/NADH) large chain
MTGGRVVVLGPTGRNFAAGMSGGIAYVLDLNDDFDFYCNKDMVELSNVSDYEDVKELQWLIEKHLFHTRSRMAETILVNWEEYAGKFVKVLPLEYKKAINEQKIKELKTKLQEVEYDPF